MSYTPLACDCGAPCANHCSRCEGCQWEAILAIVGWDEEKAERESIGAMRELKNRGSMNRRAGRSPRK